MVGKVAKRSLGGVHTLYDSIIVNVEGASGEEVVDVIAGLLNVPLDIHSETRSLRDSQAVIESDNSREAAETDEDAPHIVNMGQDSGVVGKDGALECGTDDQRDKSGSKVAPTLEGKDGGHETAADGGGGELGGDDGGEGIVATDSYTHNEAPDDEDAKDIDTMCITSESLTKGSDDDDHKLDAIYK